MCDVSMQTCEQRQICIALFVQSQQLDTQPSLAERPVAIVNGCYLAAPLPTQGFGLDGFSDEFKHHIEPLLSGKRTSLLGLCDRRVKSNCDVC